MNVVHDILPEIHVEEIMDVQRKIIQRVQNRAKIITPVKLYTALACPFLVPLRFSTQLSRKVQYLPPTPPLPQFHKTRSDGTLSRSPIEFYPRMISCWGSLETEEADKNSIQHNISPSWEQLHCLCFILVFYFCLCLRADVTINCFVCVLSSHAFAVQLSRQGNGYISFLFEEYFSQLEEDISSQLEEYFLPVGKVFLPRLKSAFLKFKIRAGWFSKCTVLLISLNQRNIVWLLCAKGCSMRKVS